MDSLNAQNFDVLFQALLDYTPSRWQRRLFSRFVTGNIPDSLDLPTGLGKTSVIPIWLVALAVQATNHLPLLPRRLAYIVNRRTVVDQSTAIVEKIRDRLIDPYGPAWNEHSLALQGLRDALLNLSSGTDDMPLAVSTLRGQLADNQEWKSDPARPAIIVGTIDMIGSKLLFSGYGDGRYHRPHHAGLIGQDTLVVHDEAHLSPPFSDLLHSVAAHQHDSGDLRPIHVLDLSATTIGGANDRFTLDIEDLDDEFVRQRLGAAKRIRFYDVEPKGFVEKVISLATVHEKTASKVLLYFQSPDLVQKVVAAIVKKLGTHSSSQIASLTGTMRGFERDKLVADNWVYRAFLDHRFRPSETIYLVSTSAGEVGVDFDADHLICELTTLDSMIQRLGRVNRRGEGPVAMVDVIAQKTEREGLETNG